MNVTATSVELTGLRPVSTYTISVRAYTISARAYTISVRAYTAAGLGEERRLTVVHTKKTKNNVFAHTVLEGYIS